MQTGSEAQLDFDSPNELMGLFDLNYVLHVSHLSSECIVFQTLVLPGAPENIHNYTSKNCHLKLKYTSF
jgi:hypothetical protein